MHRLRVGIVGIGNISGIYLKNLTSYASTEIVAVADLDQARAEKAAAEYNIPNALSVDELLSHPDVDLVLNLTIPVAHGRVALQAVRAGKHVYNEKPLSIDLDEAKLLVKEAADRGLYVGCAPDTFLGGGHQTARAAIESGVIGDVVGAQAHMLSRGPEGWHPSPEFFFKPGAGPMLDMGPYYITALVNMLGPVKRTTGITRISFPERPVPLTNKGFYGENPPAEPTAIKVETETHLVGVMEFVSGPVAEITTSFDVYGIWSNHPITVYGSKGTMKVPDPNGFGGEVLVRLEGEEEFKPLEVNHGFNENSRGIGVLDIAYAIAEKRKNRASGDLALHVLETMLSFEKASKEGKHQLIETPLERPAALTPEDFAGEVPPAAEA